MHIERLPCSPPISMASPENRHSHDPKNETIGENAARSLVSREAHSVLHAMRAPPCHQSVLGLAAVPIRAAAEARPWLRERVASASNINGIRLGQRGSRGRWRIATRRLVRPSCPNIIRSYDIHDAWVERGSAAVGIG